MFYERFLALCNTHGVKPSIVAETIGLSRANTTYWKNGSMPSTKNLQKLADYFGVPVDYLLGTQDSITIDVRDPAEMQETISKAETEKNRMLIEKLVQDVDTIPEQYKDEAIQELAHVMQYVLHKYKTMVPNESFIGP